LLVHDCNLARGLVSDGNIDEPQTGLWLKKLFLRDSQAKAASSCMKILVDILVDTTSYRVFGVEILEGTWLTRITFDEHVTRRKYRASFSM
jgi:hypothetical protein